MRCLIAISLFFIAATPALAAGSASVGEIAIRDAWVRASIGNAPNSAAYMTIETTREGGDRLTGATSPAAGGIQLHTHVVEEGVARMRHLAAIEVAPGAPAVLTPGGHHLMLTGLKEKLEEGATIPLTLTFEQAGEVPLEVPVRTATGGMRHGQGGSPAQDGAVMKH